MQFSIIGALVCVCLWLMARNSPEPLVTALIASLAFGTTAIVILPALGGSSPVIYVVFLCALLAVAMLRRDAVKNISEVLSLQPAASVVTILLFYTFAGAILLPRIFAGQATVFVPLRDEARIAEVPLVPVAGNITQTLYFALGALCFFAISMLLRKQQTLIAVRKGFFAWATLHVAMGSIDLFGKLAGLGDVLAPIRTASYSMLTEVDVAGFWRIVGGYSEASSFGAISALLLAFTFVYWRRSRDNISLVLWLALSALLVLSTSSTAYVSGGMLLTALLVSIVGAALRDRLHRQDLFLLVGGLAVLLVVIGTFLYREGALDPLWALLDAMVFKKSSSASAAERAYWNYRSLQSFYDTAGLGVGLGSSRASSWVIAVFSQLGIVGTVLIMLLLSEVLRGGRLWHESKLDFETRVTAMSLRACSITALATSAISGGGADPGMVFFITLAVLTSLKATSRQAKGRLPMSNVGLYPWMQPSLRTWADVPPCGFDARSRQRTVPDRTTCSR
jgi:hypothetical protein